MKFAVEKDLGNSKSLPNVAVVWWCGGGWCWCVVWWWWWWWCGGVVVVVRWWCGGGVWWCTVYGVWCGGGGFDVMLTTRRVGPGHGPTAPDWAMSLWTWPLKNRHCHLMASAAHGLDSQHQLVQAIEASASERAKCSK